MGHRHNTLSDDIFKNSKYIHTLEQALEIDNFKKEYKAQYNMMLDVFKTLILVNNVFFADSNKNTAEKKNEIYNILFRIVFKSGDSDRLKYGLRLQKELKDSHTRYLYKQLVDWFNGLNTYSFDTLKLKVEKEMTRLENVDFDKVVKGSLQYEKNKNSEYRIYASKLDYLYPNKKKAWEEYEKDFYDTYGITLDKKTKDEIYFIYKLVAYANNGIIKLLFNDKIKDFGLTIKDNAEDYFKAYLTSLNIDIKENKRFIADSQIFYKEFLTLQKDFMEYEKNNKNKSLISMYYNELDNVIGRYDLYFFYINMYLITNNMVEFTIKTDFIVKIINDLKEIYNLIYDNVPNITNESQVQEALAKVQSIINRNEKMFERLS